MSGGSSQPSNSSGFDPVIEQVTQVYHHLTRMLEHNRNVYFDRVARLEALKRRRVELIAQGPSAHEQRDAIWGMMEQQHQHQQQDYNHLLNWLNQQACQDGGARGEPIIPPPPPPLVESPGTRGTTGSEWTYRQGHPPSPISTDYYSHFSASAYSPSLLTNSSQQSPPPPHVTPPPQNSVPSHPLATSTPVRERTTCSPPPVSSATGYLSFSDETSTSSARFRSGNSEKDKQCQSRQNPYRSQGALPSAPCSPSTAATFSIISPPPPPPPGTGLENVSASRTRVQPSVSSLASTTPKTPDICSQPATEGVTGFQILHCPDCNARLGIIFEIIHLDCCPNNAPPRNR